MLPSIRSEQKYQSIDGHLMILNGVTAADSELKLHNHKLDLVINEKSFFKKIKNIIFLTPR